jgi:hypothetical protein
MIAGTIWGMDTQSLDDIRTAELRIPLTQAELARLDSIAGADTATWARLVLLREAQLLAIQPATLSRT